MAAGKDVTDPPQTLSIDPKSGFSTETNTFHSLRPSLDLLPPETLPLSLTSYIFSLLPSPLPAAHPALIDASTGLSLSYSALLAGVRSLSFSLHSRFRLSEGHVAFVLSPNGIHVPVLYLSLLSLGVAVAPASPLSTPAEISRQCRLVAPVSIAFATSSTVSKLPPDLHNKLILLDSPEFSSLLRLSEESANYELERAAFNQGDTVAAIQFSSGTTGPTKAAALSHRCFVTMVAEQCQLLRPRKPDVTVLVAPMFHSMGFFYALKGLALAETVVVMERPGFPEMLGAAERYRATTLTAAPPVVVAMARSEAVEKYDLGALETVVTGGAPLSVEAATRFVARFPRVGLRQGYGSTEGGTISIMINNEECNHFKSVGRLSKNQEAKIVDVVTGKTLSVGQQGELLLRGPTIMLGYVGDDEANKSSFDSGSWLKTGDLCYFNNDGFLHVVDRLKELIKYKGYQVPPAELEHLLLLMPDIIDVAVIPFPQEEVGQIPVAFVVKQFGSKLNEEQVMDYIAKQVAPYKKIRKVVFIDSIPKSATGKILRRELANHPLCQTRL